ncbi:flagellar hook-length control protein FliK [Clostridium saccharobutylicum]|uniref:Flagellar hook-length control protein FliK n=1 Tax=Clostridium saccharobutylicum TaxID=169679 RepID=A0A1S8NIJ4_CLOSA|nr:flagellar hook-length control protein FliK [Clostridium saccharobutylicum]OOM16238.1 flagellar hook-length control protein FliK [Clostridium saccharobutylicum]
MASTNTTDYLVSNMNFSTQGSKSNVSNKFESNSFVDKTNSSKSTEYNNEFRKVLNSKTNSKDESNEKLVDKTKENKSLSDVDNNEINELKDKLKKLEEDSKSDSKDDVNEILQSLLNLLKKFEIKEEKGDVNSELLKSIMLNGINENGSSDKQSTILNQLLELLKSDSVQKKLDSDSLGLMNKILNQLGIKSKDNKELSSGIKDLMSHISNIIDNKDSQGEKVLTLRDMLNNGYSQNKDSSLENGNNNNSQTETPKESKKVTKEDKFLNSLIDDKKDNSLDKINLFASRTQAIQGQGVETTRGLTINKATFANDLIKDVKFMSNNGLKELTVKINPGNLGEITINLSQEDGVMKANLKANSKETVALLSQNLADIKGKLTEQNIKVSDVNIELYQDDTTFFKEEGFGGQLAQEQGKNSNNQNSNNTINNVSAVEEDAMENITSGYNNNLDFRA